jgi:hypothetical protein
MATTDSGGVAMSTRLGTTVIGIGVIAALGSAFVAMGLADLLAIMEGYRPSHSLAFDYGQAFVVAAAGWSLMAVAAVHTVRAARSAA